MRQCDLGAELAAHTEGNLLGGRGGPRTGNGHDGAGEGARQRRLEAIGPSHDHQRQWRAKQQFIDHGRVQLALVAAGHADAYHPVAQSGLSHNGGRNDGAGRAGHPHLPVIDGAPVKNAADDGYVGPPVAS